MASGGIHQFLNPEGTSTYDIIFGVTVKTDSCKCD